MNISKVTNCYGCLACLDKCPQKCIQINKNTLGHLYPYVSNKCINCGACLKVCPAENNNLYHSILHTWAVWRNDDKLRMESSSGGLASAISEFFILKGGIVYGCAFIPEFSFAHVRCESFEDLKKIKGSKYVQSNMNGVFHSIKNDLEHNKKILFIGTPCQVASINLYFRNQLDSIYTIDLICHGVPSEQLLKESIPNKIFDSAFDKVIFRDNIKYHFSIIRENSIIYQRPLHKDLFLKGFFTALFYRNSCYTCKFATKRRVGDITVGDFWGIDKKTITADFTKGISLCIVNSDKGDRLFEQIPDITKIKRSETEAIDGNKQLQHPVGKTIRSKIFSLLYPLLGFKYSVVCSIPEIIIKNSIIRF